jgi:hypothetical protein
MCIKPSLELVAGQGVGDCDREKHQRKNNHEQIKHGKTSSQSGKEGVGIVPI